MNEKIYMCISVMCDGNNKKNLKTNYKLKTKNKKKIERKVKI